MNDFGIEPKTIDFRDKEVNALWKLFKNIVEEFHKEDDDLLEDENKN